MNPVKTLLVALAVFCAAWVASGCGSNDSAAGNADSTSTVVASAEGSMESDAENYGEGEGQKAKEEKKEDKPKKEKSTSVNAAKAFSGDLVLPVVAEGAIRARHTTEIRTEISGKLIRVHVQEGQQVRRGQLVAKLDDRELEAAVEESRATYLQALSLLSIEDDSLEVSELAQQVRDEFANLEKLERSGEISREERYAREIKLDIDAIRGGKFRYEVAAARSGVSVARAALERARINLERTEIRAPYQGVITGLRLSRGEQLVANETICAIVDNLNIEAEVGVLEADLAHVEVGKPVLLSVPALDLTLPVQVDVVSPQFDRETRTCQVLLRLKNEDGRLRPGMFVRARIAGATYHDRLLVPREAVLTREGRPLLFKVEDKRAKWLYIKIGESNNHLVEIERVLQGGNLEPDDKVIVSNHLTLAHDAKVKVKKTLPVSDPWVVFTSADQ